MLGQAKSSVLRTTSALGEVGQARFSKFTTEDYFHAFDIGLTVNIVGSRSGSLLTKSSQKILKALGFTNGDLSPGGYQIRIFDYESEEELWRCI